MKHLLTRALVIGTLIACMHNTIAQPAAKQASPYDILKDRGELYFRFPLTDNSLGNELTRLISIDKATGEGLIYAYANEKGFAKFLDYGIDYEILPPPGIYNGDLNMKSQVDIRNIAEWDFYPTYDAYVSMMYQFAADYPGICQVFSIGTSVGGRQLLVAKISDNVGVSEAEPEFLYTSSIHGDETTGYVLMLRMIDYLLSNYGSDPGITNLVNGIEIWINPLANPDGTYWGGNSTVNNAKRYNANNVDLNRNFPDPADGPHPDGEEWQVETLAFMDFAESRHFVSGANLHGGTEVCNYPWDTWPRLAADDLWWKYVCHQYADTAQAYSPSGYMSDYDDGITNGYTWYRITGGRQDYMNYFHQCREFTLEISNTKLLPPGELPALWNYNYRSLLNYMEQSMYGLRGVIRDSLTNWPLETEIYAVLHEKDSSWVYSDLPGGNYHRLLPQGTYTLRYSAPGYVTKVMSGVTITYEAATELNVFLVPEGGVGGIDQNEVSIAASLSPNPANSGTVYLRSRDNIDWVEVYTLNGTLISRVEPMPESGFVDVSGLSNGMFLVKFGTQAGPGVKKLVVAR